jgi:heme-binding protein
MRRSGKIGLGCVAVLAAAQGIRFARTNPPVTGEIGAPADIAPVLRRACYDCHSNETVWPWYSQIAPFSWLLQRDVEEGRRRLNFSEWDEYASDPGTASVKLTEIATSVALGGMAPWYYRMLHPAARLSAVQRELLRQWAEGAAGQERLRS